MRAHDDSRDRSSAGPTTSNAVKQVAVRQQDGVLAGLLAAWTWLPLAMWFAVLGALADAAAGAIGGANSEIAHALHLGEGVGFGSAVAGAFVGGFFGLLLVYKTLVEHPATLLGDLVSGAVVGAVALYLSVRFEDKLLRLRGYRELSKRERLLVDPVVDDVLARLGIVGKRPNIYVSDQVVPGAWTHANSIVLSRGLLGAYDDSENPPIPDMPSNAFAAVITHEIMHWKCGDAVGLKAVWCMCFPIALTYQLVHRGAEVLDEQPILDKFRLSRFTWIVFWPAWVSVELVIKPALATASRRSEYDADAAVAALGDDYRIGLRTALGHLEDFEKPRTGWEDVLHSTHPPIELRQQRLEVAYLQPQIRPIYVAREDGRLAKLIVYDPAVLAVARDGHLSVDATTPIRNYEAPGLNAAIIRWLRGVENAINRGEAVDISVAPHEVPLWIASLESESPPDPNDDTKPTKTRPRVNATTTRVAKPSKPRAKKPSTKRPATGEAPTSTKPKKRPRPTSEPSGDASAQWQLPGDDQIQPAM